MPPPAEAAPPAPAPAPAAAAPAPPAAVVVLSPAPLAYADGIDARLLGATACCAWLAHAAVAATAWAKLSAGAVAEEEATLTWGAAFAPQWLSHGAQCTLHALALLHSDRLVAAALGGEAARRAAGATLAEAAFRAEAAQQLRTRHVVQHASHMVDSLAALATKALFCVQLQAHDAARAAGGERLGWQAMRLVLVPLWLGWLGAAGITWAGRRRAEEPANGSSGPARSALRDGRYVFFLLIACKLYGLDAFSWRALCGGGWGGAGLAAAAFAARAGSSGLSAALRAPGGGALAQGALFIAAGCGLVAFASFRLADWMDGRRHATPDDVCLPACVGWAVAWCGTIIAFRGLLARAAAAAAAAAARATAAAPNTALWDWGTAASPGGVTAPAPAALLAALAAGRAQGARDWVDALSDSAVVSLAAQLGAAKTAPPRLLRASARLYRFPPPAAAAADADAARTPQRSTLLGGEGGGGGCDSEHISVAVEDAAPPPAEIDAAAAGRDGGDGGDDDDDDDDGVCFVCCDARPECVLLPCGHGGVCCACAARLWVRPPHECATCRAPVALVVQLADADAAAAAPPGGSVAVTPLRPPQPQLAQLQRGASPARVAQPRQVQMQRVASPAGALGAEVGDVAPQRAAVRFAGGLSRPAPRTQLSPDAL